MPLRVQWFFFEFSQRISELYPEVFQSGTTESESSNYFQKWGWYATIDSMAKGKIWHYDKVTNTNVHKFLLYLCHKRDKQRVKEMIIKKQLA